MQILMKQYIIPTEEKYKMEDEKIIYDKICEECGKDENSVKQNLIIHGFKICNSCKLSKTIFPL